MSAEILDGKEIAAQIIRETGRRIDARVSEGRSRPALAVVLVGADPASEIYVRNKRLACERAGIISISHDLPDSTQEQELLALITRLNEDPEVHGILVQLPLPAHINEHRVTDHIDPNKDVDGFHPVNMGRLALRRPGLRPCTPKGITSLLAAYDIDPKRQHAVVVGASNIVGRPMMLELVLAGATVTICHKFTKALEYHVAQADILVVAVGIEGLIPGQWIQRGCVVIDVGMNRRADGSLCGDVEFDVALERASAITPVPGGVGPLTVATVIQNTLEAAELQEQCAAESSEP